MSLYPNERRTLTLGEPVRLPDARTGKVHAISPAYQRSVCVVVDGERNEHGLPVFEWYRPADLN